jgi:hypothetical protein
LAFFTSCRRLRRASARRRCRRGGQQVGGQRRQRWRPGIGQRGGFGERHVGLADQRGQRVAGELHLFLQRFDLLARFGQRAFALAQFQRGVEAGAHALAHQLQLLFALRQRALATASCSCRRTSWK